MSVRIKNVRYKPLDLNDVVEMHRISIVNSRYLTATVHHLSAMVNALTAKVDKPLRDAYELKVKLAQKRLLEEQKWVLVFANTLSKHNVKVSN